MTRLTVNAAFIVAILWCGTASAADSVTIRFDPADFYSWRPVAEGFSTDGGMFKLHETWQGPNTLESYIAADRPALENLKTSLGSGEGIGFFNVDLNESGNGMLWGQTLETPMSIDGVIAPPGWTGEINGNFVSWEADDSSLFVRPDTTAYDSGNAFGFTFTTEEDIIGTDQTIWFGGFNFNGFIPAISFDSFTGGFPSNNTGEPGTGFEATLSLTPIPEPATVVLMGIGAVLALGVRAVRRRTDASP